VGEVGEVGDAVPPLPCPREETRLCERDIWGEALLPSLLVLVEECPCGEMSPECVTLDETLVIESCGTLLALWQCLRVGTPGLVLMLLLWLLLLLLFFSCSFSCCSCCSDLAVKVAERGIE